MYTANKCLFICKIYYIVFSFYIWFSSSYILLVFCIHCIFFSFSYKHLLLSSQTNILDIQLVTRSIWMYPMLPYGAPVLIYVFWNNVSVFIMCLLAIHAYPIIGCFWKLMICLYDSCLNLHFSYSLFRHRAHSVRAWRRCPRFLSEHIIQSLCFDIGSHWYLIATPFFFFWWPKTIFSITDCMKSNRENWGMWIVFKYMC